MSIIGIVVDTMVVPVVFICPPLVRFVVLFIWFVVHFERKWSIGVSSGNHLILVTGCLCNFLTLLLRMRHVAKRLEDTKGRDE